MSHKFIRWAVVAALLIGQSIYILLFYREGIYADQWDLVPMLHAYLSGENWLSKVLALHGGHYHTSAYLIMLPLAKMTNWSLLAETFVILILNFLTFCLLYHSALSAISKSKQYCSTIIFICFTALYFSIAHGGNALWSWQIAVYLCIFGFAITLFCLSRPQLSPLILVFASTGALLSSFSFSCGFAILPAGLFMILMNHETQNKRIYAIVWVILSCLILGNFIYHISLDGSSGIKLNLLQIPEFLLYYLGTPIAYFSRDLSLLIAAIGLFVFSYSGWCVFTQLNKSNRALFKVGLAMAIFSLSCGILIALGRLPFGIDQARSFRYIIFAQFFWFAVLLLIWQHLQLKAQHNGSVKKSTKYLLGLFLVLVVFNAQKIGKSAAEVAQSYDQVFALLKSPSSSNIQAVINYAAYPDKTTLNEHLLVLKNNKLSILHKQ